MSSSKGGLRAAIRMVLEVLPEHEHSHNMIVAKTTKIWQCLWIMHDIVLAKHIYLKFKQDYHPFAPCRCVINCVYILLYTLAVYVSVLFESTHPSPS